MKIGILSDTHGILRSELLATLQECDYLIHAGDINTGNSYKKLKELGIPIYMVRGNCDMGEWAEFIPDFLQVPIGGKRFFIVHNQADLPFDLTDADYIIFGHTHRYTCYDRFGKIFLNPGSASQPRDGSRSIAILEQNDDNYEIRRVLL